MLDRGDRDGNNDRTTDAGAQPRERPSRTGVRGQAFFTGQTSR